jgi:hypothetical protein
MRHGALKEEGKEREEDTSNFMIVLNVWNCLSRLATKLTLRIMISLHHFLVPYRHMLIDHSDF